MAQNIHPALQCNPSIQLKDAQPVPRRSIYDDYLSDAARRMKPSPIHSLLHLERTVPRPISVLGGKPNPVMFPFAGSLSFTIKDPSHPSNNPKNFADKNALGATTPAVEGAGIKTLTMDRATVEAALQYGETPGLHRMLDWLTMLQENEHKRTQKTEGWRISVGNGSQDLIAKAAIAILNPGDHMIVESPTYAGVLPFFESLQVNLIDVPTDAHGVRIEQLREVLETWPVGVPKPKILYTIPYGCNPSGTTVSHERRVEVLKLAKEHDFIIFEDDPYYYLYYGDAPRPPSYLCLEKQLSTLDPPTAPASSDPEESRKLKVAEHGRVIRFDSFSKVLSAGLRLGWVTGPHAFIDAIDNRASATHLEPPSITQCIALTILESWGLSGLKAHTDNVAAFYKMKRDTCSKLLHKHLGKDGYATWDDPQAGLFMWFKLNLLPAGSTLDPSVEDSYALIRNKAAANGILAMAGSVFLPKGGVSPYVRFSFSSLDEETMDEALRRLREVVVEARAELAARGA